MKKIYLKNIIILLSLYFLHIPGFCTPVLVHKFETNFFSSPIGVTVDSLGSIYVSDIDIVNIISNIYKYDLTGNNRTTFLTSNQSTFLGIATGKHTDGKDTLYLTESQNFNSTSYILKGYHIEDNFLALNTDPTTYQKPLSITIKNNSNGNGFVDSIYLATQNNEIGVYKLGSGPQPSIPLGNGVNATSLSYNSLSSYLWAALLDQNKVKMIGQAIEIVSQNSLSSVVTLNTNDFGTIWITDRTQNNILSYQYNPNTSLFDIYKESPPNSFIFPKASAINEKTGQIIIIDEEGNAYIYHSGLAWIKSGFAILQDLPLVDDLTLDSALSLPNVPNLVNRRLRVSKTDAAINGDPIGGSGILGVTGSLNPLYTATLLLQDSANDGLTRLEVDNLQLNTQGILSLDGGKFQTDLFQLNNGTIKVNQNTSFEVADVPSVQLVNNGNRLQIASGKILTINSPLMGNGTLKVESYFPQQGPQGILQLFANNSGFNGLVEIDEATVEIGANLHPLGTNQVTLLTNATLRWMNDATVSNHFTITGTARFDTSSFAGRLNGSLSGNGQIEILDDLSIGLVGGAPNTLTGPISIAPNTTVTLFKTNALGSQNPGLVTMKDKSVIKFGADVSVANQISVEDNTAIFDTTGGNGILNGAIQAADALKEVIIRGGKKLTYFVQNLYIAKTEVQANTTLELILLNGLPASPVNLLGASAKLLMEAENQIVKSLTGVTGSEVILGGKEIILAEDSDFDGIFLGNGGIVRPFRNLALGGTNTYTGILRAYSLNNPITITMKEGSSLSPDILLHLLSNGAFNPIFDMSEQSQTIGKLLGIGNGIIELGDKTLTIAGSATNLGDSVFDGEFRGVEGNVTAQHNLSLGGQHTNTGTLKVDASNNHVTVTMKANSSLAAESSLNLMSVGANIATFDMQASSQEISNLSGNANSIIKLNGQRLTVNIQQPSIFAGNIEGAGGSFAKKGPSILTLLGNNIFDGGLHLQEGTLIVEGSIRDVVVEAGGRLTGLWDAINNRGFVGNVINDGLITPSNPVGEFRIKGDYSSPNSGTIQIDVSPLIANKIHVEGQANLNGSHLAVNIVSGEAADYKGKSFEVLSSDNLITTQFSDIQSSQARYRFKADYTTDPYKVFIEVGSRTLKEIVSEATSDPNKTENAGSFDTVYEQLNHSNLKFDHYMDTLLSLSPKEAADAVAMIVPEETKDLAFSVADTTSQIFDVIGLRTQYTRSYEDLAVQRTNFGNSISKTNHFRQIFNKFKQSFTSKTTLEQVFGEQKSSLNSTDSMLQNTLIGNHQGGIWIQGYGDHSKQKEAYQQLSYHARTGGGLVGIDYKFKPNLVIGAVMGHGVSRLHFQDDAMKARIKDYFMGIYSTFNLHNFYIDTSLIIGLNRFRTDRKIKFADIDLMAKGRHNGMRLSPHIGFGYTFKFANKVKITPFVKLDYIHVLEKGYKEHNADILNLNMKKKQTSYLKTKAGINLSKDYVTDFGIWSPKVSIGINNSKVLRKDKVRANLMDVPLTLVANTPTKTQTMLAPGLSLNYSSFSGLFSSVGYSAQMNRRFKSHEVTARLGWKF